MSLLTYVLGLLCHPGDSSVAGNKLRSSRMTGFLAALVLLVRSHVPIGFLVLSRYLDAANHAGQVISFQDILLVLLKSGRILKLLNKIY